MNSERLFFIALIGVKLCALGGVISAVTHSENKCDSLYIAGDKAAERARERLEVELGIELKKLPGENEVIAEAQASERQLEIIREAKRKYTN